MRAVQRIAKNTLVSTSSEVINKILSVFLYIAIANYLRTIGYGQFSFIMALLGLFQVLANFGLDKLTIREVAKDKKSTHNYLTLMLKTRFFLALITCFLLILCIHLMGKPANVIFGVYLISLAMIFISLSNTFMSIFNAHERLEINAVLLIFVKLLVFGLTLFVIYLKYSLLFILGIFVIGEAVRTLLYYLIYLKSFHDIKLDKTLALSVKTILRTAVPFVIVGVTWLIYVKIDVIMLSLMKGDEVVGWYSAASTLFLGLMFIPRCYTLSVFPVISRYAQDSNKLLNISWQKSVKFLLIVSLPISLGVILLADRLIPLFYPSGVYENSISALKILMLSVPLFFTNSINMYLLYAVNRQKQATIIMLVSATLNITLNFILIPKLSYIGASWATVLAEIVNVSIFFVFIYMALNLKVKIHSILFKPLLATIIMGIFIYYFRSINLGFLVVASGFVYLILLLLLKVLDEEDRKILGRIIPFVTIK